MTFVIKEVIPDEYSYVSTDINNTSWAIFNESLLFTFQEEIVNTSASGIAVFRVRPVGSKNNKDCYVCVKEFSANDEHIIIPTTLFNTLECEPTSTVVIEYVSPPKAINIRLKPVNNTFYDIEDIKSMLEITIQKNYPVIRIGQYINVNYFDEIIPVEITHIEPSNLCTTIDTDVEVEFENIGRANENGITESDHECEIVEGPKKKPLFSSIRNTRIVKKETDSIMQTETEVSTVSTVSIDEVRAKRLARFNVKN